MRVKRRYFLWGTLVMLNAIVGLIFSLPEDRPPADYFAIFCGILTFMVLYIETDYWLARSGKEQLRRRLVISTFIRAGFQLMLYVDLYAGLLALLIVEEIVGYVLFLSVYLTVLIDGLLLSVLVAVILFIAGLVAPILLRWKQRWIRAS